MKRVKTEAQWWQQFYDAIKLDLNEPDDVEKWWEAKVHLTGIAVAKRLAAWEEKRR